MQAVHTSLVAGIAASYVIPLFTHPVPRHSGLILLQMTRKLRTNTGVFRFLDDVLDTQKESAFYASVSFHNAANL